MNNEVIEHSSAMNIHKQSVEDRINKVMSTFERRLDKGFAQKDFIHFKSTGINKNVWGSTYTELAVAKHLNREIGEDAIMVPTEILTDRKRALELQRKMSTDVVERFLSDDGRWYEGKTRVDVKLQDRASDFGTFNVEWSVDGNTQVQESNIHHSMCSHYCYVCQGIAYLIRKADLYELAKSLPTVTNRAGYNRSFQTKRVPIQDMKSKAIMVFDLGDKYLRSMEHFYEVAD